MSKQTEDSRVAAIDLGKARIGVAISDELGALAHPRPALKRGKETKSDKAVLEALASLAREQGVVRFLVGLPLSMSGRQGAAARRAARFCQRLADATGVEVELIDERLTTVQAERELAATGFDREQIKSRVDSVAAAIMLQQWLDARRLQAQ